MKVLITGVAGFIGSNLLDYLMEHTDWHITGVDNFSTGNKENIKHHLNGKRFELQEKQCTDITTLKPFDKVFHLAALPRIQPSFELIVQHVQANLVNSVHLLEVMIKDNHFPRLVYSGSSAIYGTPKNIPTAEDEPVDCLSPYAFQKYEFEKYLELIATRFPLDYVILRYFNPYGPRSFNPANKFNAYSSVVGIFLNKYKNGEDLLVTGDGRQKRDFIHVSDLASANHLASIHLTKLNTAFNIGNGSTLSILELAKMISSKYSFIPKREGEADITFADVTKAKTILKWKPTHKIEEYLKQVKGN
jgi:UDP-glucose 4-epimerase